MKYLKAFDNHIDYTIWTNGQGDTEFIRPSVGYCINEDEVHFNGKIGQYVDLGLQSGNLWATCNLGSDDPYMPGLYYAWGDLSGYTANQVGTDKNFNDSDYIYGSHDALTKYNDMDGLKKLAQSDDAAYDELGQTDDGYWHIPTPKDFDELVVHTNKVYDEAHNCYIFTSQINGKKLIMPLAGVADDGFINYRNDFGKYGAYWTDMLYYVDSVDITNAYAAYLNQDFSGGLEQCRRFCGLQIRPVFSTDFTPEPQIPNRKFRNKN